MSNKLNTTIVICALNEEKNIGNLLNDILNQNTSQYEIQKIYVISDGSKDRTNDLVESFKSNKIILKKYQDRRGKVYRLKNIFKEVTSEYVVVIDADLRLADDKCIYHMVSPFSKDKNIAMIGGNHQPYQVNNFLQKSIKSSFNAYSNLRQKYPSLSFGPIIAYRSSFAKKINYPNNISGEDAFGYLKCLQMGYKYLYSDQAKVHFKLPNSLSDHIAQNQRFQSVNNIMKNHFPKNLVDSQSNIDKKDLLRSTATSFIGSPIHTIAIFLINQYCKLFMKMNQGKINSNWTMSTSTK